MKQLSRFGASVLFTTMCLLFAIIPELIMYIAWGLINPESELTRVLLLCAFWFGGSGLCLLFGAIAFIAWIKILEAL